MSSQLSAHAITAHTAMTRTSVSRCSTLPAHRGSSSAEKCSTSFLTDIATLPSLMKGEPQRPVRPSNPASLFHASPLFSGGRTGSGAEVEVDCQPPRGNRLEDKDRFPTGVRLDGSITDGQRLQALTELNSQTECFS